MGLFFDAWWSVLPSQRMKVDEGEKVIELATVLFSASMWV